jgi:hypothetical protein
VGSFAAHRRARNFLLNCPVLEYILVLQGELVVQILDVVAILSGRAGRSFENLQVHLRRPTTRRVNEFQPKCCDRR